MKAWWWDVPNGHYVSVKLPDGRIAFTEHGTSIARTMRRVLSCRAATPKRDPDPADYEIITLWWDLQERAKCGGTQMARPGSAGSTGGTPGRGQNLAGAQAQLP